MCNRFTDGQSQMRKEKVKIDAVKVDKEREENLSDKGVERKTKECFLKNKEKMNKDREHEKKLQVSAYEQKSSVTRKKLPNVYKSCPKMISLEK